MFCIEFALFSVNARFLGLSCNIPIYSANPEGSFQCIVHFTSVQCWACRIVYSQNYSLCNTVCSVVYIIHLQCALFSSEKDQYNVHFQCVAYSVQFKEYSDHYTVYCILHTVHCAETSYQVRAGPISINTQCLKYCPLCTVGCGVHCTPQHASA